jgi:NAD+ kinase
MPERWQQVMSRILAGEGEIEKRLMLQVDLLREGDVIAQDVALNDAVISRGALARTLRLEASVDDAKLTRYVADGLILATATGSTAYSYAVGGPILPPWIDNILLVPIAAHLSLDRPLVLSDEAVIDIVVHTEVPGMLTVDGRLSGGELQEGDRVRISRSTLRAHFLRLRSRGDFYRTLVERLTPRNGEGL